MGLNDFYHNLEDKYYSSLDWLEAKGIPLYKLDDLIAKMNLPSFPIVSLIMLIIVLGIVYGIYVLLFAQVAVGSVTLTFMTQDVTTAYVPGIEVSLASSSAMYGPVSTNDRGEAEFAAPIGEELSISISGDEYTLGRDTVVFESDGDNVNVYLNRGELRLSKTFRLIEDPTTNALLTTGVDVEVSCTDGYEEYSQSFYVDTGVLELDDLPSGCSSVQVQVSNYELRNVNLNEDVVSVFLEGEIPKGEIEVICVDSNSSAMQDAQVRAYNSEGIIKAQGATDEAGRVLLEVPEGQYYLSASDSFNVYSEVITNEQGEENYFNEAVTSENVGANKVTHTIKFTQKSNGSVRISVKDPSGNLVTDGEVTLLNGETPISSKNLGETQGEEIVFGVRENIEYKLYIDAPTFMKHTSTISPSPNVQNITLTLAKGAPEYEILVLGLDSEPVSLATVELISSFNDESAVVEHKITGFDGTVRFDRLDSSKKYHVRVSKGDYMAETSPIVLTNRELNKTTAILEIGSGNVTVEVMDSSNEAIVGAQVELFDISGASVSTTKTTDVSGIVESDVRADYTVYAKVSKEGYSDYYTLPKAIVSGMDNIFSVNMVQEVNSPRIELLGIYENDERIGSEQIVVRPASAYMAKFLVKVPKGKAYDEAQVVLVAEGVQDSSMSSIHIDSLSMLKADISYGDTFTSPQGYAQDMINKTDGSGIWARGIVDDVEEGTYIVKAKFSVVSEPVNDILPLGYRLELKRGSTYIRDPQDSVLGGQSGSVSKAGFYADRKIINLIAGNAICSSVYCAEFEVKNTQGVTSSVYDTLYAQENGQYEFNIVNMFATGSRSYNDATLEIVSENSSVEFSAPNILKNGSRVNARQSDPYAIVADIGVVSAGQSISGLFGMKPKVSGSSPVVIRVKTDSDVLFEHRFNVDVEPAGEMVVSLIPEVIIPFVDNNLLVYVEDSVTQIGVSGAHVDVIIDGASVFAGNTGFDGRVGFKVERPNIGSEVEIDVTKAGYKDASLKYEIDTSIVEVLPPKLSNTINSRLIDSVRNSFTISNLTLLDLKIANIKLAKGEHEEFINLNFDDSYIGKSVDNNIDLNYTVSLTDLGRGLLDPQNFETTLLIDLESMESSKIWQVEVPVQVYIQFGGSLDSGDCIDIYPAGDSDTLEWNIMLTGAGEQRTEEFIINNTCTYEGVEANLYVSDISLVWKGKDLGEFSTGDIVITRDDSEFIELVEYGETRFVLDFKSDESMVSEESTADIKVKSYFPTNDGLQEVTGSVPVNVTISDMASCLQIVGPSGNLNGLVNNIPVVVISNQSFGAGYEMYEQMFGGMPSFAGGLQTSMNPLQMAQLQAMQAGVSPNQYAGREEFYRKLYGSSGLNDPSAQMRLQSGLFSATPNTAMMDSGMFLDGSMIPGYASIKIINECKFPVTVDARTMPQLMISTGSIDLKPSESKEFTVQSRGFVGDYGIEIIGKYGSLEYVPIISIPVRVMDMSEAGADCFWVSEKDIDMSSILRNTKRIQVYNKCYTKGIMFGDVPLQQANLFVAENLIKEKNPEAKVESEDGKIPYVTIGSPRANVKNDPQYGRIQVAEGLLSKSPEIQRIAYRDPQTGSEANKIIGKASALRTDFIKQYASYSFPAELIVNYKQGTQEGSEIISVNVIDKWQLLGFGDVAANFFETGNPNCTPDMWANNVNASGVSYDAKASDFSQGRLRVPPTSGYELLNVQECFGKMDRVKFNGTPFTAKNNSQFELVPYYDNKSGQVYFELVANSDVTKNGTKTLEFDVQFSIVSTQNPNAPYKSFTKKVVIRLDLDEDITASSTPADDSQTDSDEDSSESLADVICTNLYDGEGQILSEYMKENIVNLGYFKGEHDKIDCSVYTEKGHLCSAQQFATYLYDKYEGSHENKVPPSCNVLDEPKATKLKDSTGTDKEVYAKAADKEPVFMKTKDIFSYKDAEKITQKVDEMLSAESIGVNEYVAVRNEVTSMLEEYELENKALLFFRKDKSSDDCPDIKTGQKVLVTEKDNKCYLSANAVNPETHKKFFTDLGTGTIGKYEFGIVLLKQDSLDGENLFVRYLLAKGLDKNPETDCAIVTAYLKADNYDKAMESFNNSGFLNKKILLADKGDFLTYGDKTGIAVVNYEMITNDDVSKIHVNAQLVKEIDTQDDFMKGVVFDPYYKNENASQETSTKMFGTCLSQGDDGGSQPEDHVKNDYYPFKVSGDEQYGLVEEASCNKNAKFKMKYNIYEEIEGVQLFDVRFKTEEIQYPEEIGYVAYIEGEFTVESVVGGQSDHFKKDLGDSRYIVYGDAQTKIAPNNEVKVYGARSSNTRTQSFELKVLGQKTEYYIDNIFDNAENYCMNTSEDEFRYARLPKLPSN